MTFFAKQNKSAEITPEFREQQKSLPVKVVTELNKYTKIKKIPYNNGEDFYFIERAGIDSVAFILYDNNAPDNRTVGLIDQYRGSYGEFIKGCYTGSLDKPDKSLVEIVIDEVKEEAGFEVTENRVYFISKEITGAATNERVNLYLVDVTNANKVDLSPESAFESNTENLWYSPQEALIKTTDFKAKLILLLAQGLIAELKAYY